MSYCLNPDCQRPNANPTEASFCQGCGSSLVLRNRYRAIKPIGQGGFGRTFLAVDKGKPTQPRCVIKQSLPQAQGTNNAQKAAELFEREAVQLDELGKHPRIPELLAYFVEDNRQYLVQEFIDGQNLAQVLEAEGAFQETQIWDLFSSLLPILQFIHTRQVIHRDIKPENIIRRSDGQLVLVDFGASKYATGTVMLKTGTTLGTPEYIAPEQALGKTTFASDLYSLGVTCIHLLTKVSPFELFDTGEDAWVWQKYLVNNPVSDQLSFIIEKLIQKATNRRYQSVEDVTKDLSVPRPSKLDAEDYYNQGIEKSKQGNNTEAIERFTKVLSINPNHADAYKFRGLAYSKQGDNQLAIADFQKAADLYLKRENTVDYQDTVGYIRKLQLATLQQQVQNWRCIQTFTRNSGLVSEVLAIAISPDGLIFAVACKDHTIKVLNLFPRREFCTFRAHSGFIRALTFSPDRTILASCSNDKTIKLWNWTNGQQICNLAGHSKAVTTIAISPDGEILASGSDDKTIKLWHIKTGKEIDTLVGHSGYVQSITFSPDGQTLASASCDKTIKLWDLKAREETHTFSGHSRCVKAVTFSKDSQTLISASENHEIKVWSLDTNSLSYTLSDSSAGTYRAIALAISPDNQVLASGGTNDNTIQMWHLGTKKLLCILSEHSNSITSLVFNPDGPSLYSGSYDKTVKVWRCD